MTADDTPTTDASTPSDSDSAPAEADEPATHAASNGQRQLSRRGTLATLASIGLVGAATGTASADEEEGGENLPKHNHLGQLWEGDPDTDRGLGIKTTGDQSRTVFGTNTADSGVGVLGHAMSAGGVGLKGMTDSDDGYGLHTPDDAKIEGTAELDTIDAATSDFALETGTVGDFDTGNIVLGHPVNEVTGDVQGACVLGGGASGDTHANKAHDWFATVVGGRRNQAGDPDSSASLAFVGGGKRNAATHEGATVVGGKINKATNFYSSLIGGQFNTSNGNHSAVFGGFNNTAGGEFAATLGGNSNVADGDYSYAFGAKADADGHDGAFVIADSDERAAIKAQNDDEVRSQMPIYAPSFNTTSARAAKTNVGPVDPQMALDGVESLEVCTWSLNDVDDGRHIGPMAEDFHDAFEVGDDDKTIATVDADGVAFAAIQGLSTKVDQKDDRIDTLEADLAAKDARIDDLEVDLAAKDARIEDQRDRIDRLESTVARKDERIAELHERLDELEACVADLA